MTDSSETGNSAIMVRRNSMFGVLLIVGVLLVLSAILIPIFRSSRTAAFNSACFANMKRTAAGMLMYAEENDGCFPGAATWMDRVEKYVPQGEGDTGSRMRCPAVGRDEYGFAISDGLSFAALGSLKDINKQVLLFESADLARNAHSKEATLPNPPRHSRSTAAYADGRATSLTGGQKL